MTSPIVVVDSSDGPKASSAAVSARQDVSTSPFSENHVELPNLSSLSRPEPLTMVQPLVQFLFD